jgi:DNA-binding MarR family transcriptional regulator
MDIEQEMADLVQYAGRLSRLVMQLAGPVPTRAESAVLAAVAERPRRITELARFVGLTQPRITTLVQSLEERGLVSREADPDDGRAVRVALSEAGRDLVEARQRRIADALVASLGQQRLDAGEVVADAAATLRVLVGALESESQSDSSSRTIPATGIDTQSGRLLSS